MKCYHFESLTSTNDEARNPRYREGDLLVAEHQSAGRGQRGHTWTSGEGMNLTASLLLEPRFLPVREQFSISRMAALALCDLLEGEGLTPRIKWTNDIYLGDRKVAGILIEHSLEGNQLGRTIIGIGLNINQTEFDPALPNPISMAQAADRRFNREELTQRLHTLLMSRYEALRKGDSLDDDYQRRLYRLHEPQRFRLPSGEEFLGTIRRVAPMGDLEVEHPDGEVRSYLFREIEFLISTRDRE